MKDSQTWLYAAALFIAFTTQACATAGNAGIASPDAASRSPTGPDIVELEALYRSRTDSAFLDVSEADAKFVSGMIGHHAQALVMSAYAPENGANSTIRILAARITNAQTDEISLMQRWLRDRKLHVPEVSATGHMRGDMDHEMMPGMLTPEQLAELEKARGGAFDRAYLTYMIQHHQGAVTMVAELFATDGAAQDDLIFKLASDVQVDQITEIVRMRQLLNRLPAPRQR